MRAVTAIYECGKIHFPFAYPERVGPVAVLVIFPDDPPEPLPQGDEWPPEHEPVHPES